MMIVAKPERVPEITPPMVIGLAGFRGLPEEMDARGKQLAEIASACETVMLVATTDTDPILRQSIRNWIYPPKLLIEWDFPSDHPDYLAWLEKIAHNRV